MTGKNELGDYLKEGERITKKIDAKSIELLETISPMAARYNSASPSTKKLSSIYFTDNRTLIKTSNGQTIQISNEELKEAEYKTNVKQIMIPSLIVVITFFLPTFLFYYLYMTLPDSSPRDPILLLLVICAILTVYFIFELTKAIKLKGIDIISKYGSESQQGPRVIRLIGNQTDIDSLYDSIKERMNNSALKGGVSCVKNVSK